MADFSSIASLPLFGPHREFCQENSRRSFPRGFFSKCEDLFAEAEERKKKIRKKMHRWRAEPVEYVDFKIVKIQPDVSFTDTNIGAGLFERAITAITLANSDTQRFTAIAEVFPHSANRSLTPVIKYSIPKAEIAKRPSKEDVERARDFFYSRKLNEWLDDIEPFFCPQIAERADAKLTALVTTTSPMFVRLGPRLILTTLRSLFIGDTRTGKGTIIR